PTLGTAYIIRHEIMKDHDGEVRLNLGVGQITVTGDKRSDVLWMKQKEPVFLREFTSTDMADMLGIGKADIDSRFPIEEVSTGISFIMVPLKSLKSIGDSYLDLKKYNEFFGNKKPEGLLVFCPETLNKENSLHVRVF